MKFSDSVVNVYWILLSPVTFGVTFDQLKSWTEYCLIFFGHSFKLIMSDLQIFFKGFKLMRTYFGGMEAGFNNSLLFIYQSEHYLHTDVEHSKMN